MEAVNRHHAIWPRRKQHTPLERAFRNHPGLVIPDVDIDRHRELHIALMPPPKISHQLMINLIDMLDAASLERPTEGIELAIRHCYIDDTNEGMRMGKHLYRQLGFLVAEPQIYIEGVIL